MTTLIHPFTDVEVKYLQRKLAVHADGIIGPKTLTAIRSVLKLRRSPEELLVLWAQRVINQSGTGPLISEDGIFGPVTDNRMATLVRMPRPVKSKAKDIVLPPRAAIYTSLPADNTRELKAYYGEPGTSLVRLKFPYPMYYGKSLVKTTIVHSKCKEGFEQLFEETLSAYGLDTVKELYLDQYSGCYNNRAIRGGTRLSTHAFGAAMDLYAAGNRLRMTNKTAVFARPEYQLFWNAVYAAGFKSLGLEKNYDFMHIMMTR